MAPPVQVLSQFSAFCWLSPHSPGAWLIFEAAFSWPYFVSCAASLLLSLWWLQLDAQMLRARLVCSFDLLIVFAHIHTKMPPPGFPTSDFPPPNHGHSNPVSSVSKYCILRFPIKLEQAPSNRSRTRSLLSPGIPCDDCANVSNVNRNSVAKC